MVIGWPEERTRRCPAPLALLAVTSALIGGCSGNENRYEPTTVNDDDAAIKLIDDLRSKGSYEDARRRLTATAEFTAERIVAAVAGQSWQFNTDPHGRHIKEQGLPCEQLTGDIARRPMAYSIQFGRPFSDKDFGLAHDIVRQEAAAYGAIDESSMFNDPHKRDVEIRGNGYEFTLGQINVATLNITGACFLLQSVVDLPPE